MAFSHKRLFLLPLDSRPVCYDMPRRLAAMAGLELSLPSPNLLGKLKTPANFKSLSRWIKNHLFENDPVIVALDTVAYGGLIASRVNTDPLPVLADRVQSFFRQIKTDACYGFSAILRIPSYNGAEEEPDYWARHGQALYRYSLALHQNGEATASGIPAPVLKDFLERRTKNHALNLSYLNGLDDGRLNYLTFCQDDTGAYGLNVQEAQALKDAIAAGGFGHDGHVQTGADEVAACMLARWMSSQREEPPAIFPLYTHDAARHLIARFDGLPIETVVHQAITACGAVLANSQEEADLCLLVHTPGSRQGDHCINATAQFADGQLTIARQILESALSPDKEKSLKLSIADVAYANGGDPRLVEMMLSQFPDWGKLYGYAAWNTSGNAIGTAISMGLIRLLAEDQKTFQAEEFARLLLIRFADDWLYQADVRHTIRQQPSDSQLDEGLLNAAMANGLSLLKTRLNLDNEAVLCTYPCERTFEIKVRLR
jgi:hypothetical protein